MEKEEIIYLLNKELEKKQIPFTLDATKMDQLAIDVSRILDSTFTNTINKLKWDKNLKINASQKELIRRALIGFPVSLDIDINDYKFEITKEDYAAAYELLYNGFQRNKSTMINSLVARIQKNYLKEKENSYKDYLNYINKLEKNKKQLLLINISADDDYNADNISEIMNEKYDSISNYHYAILIFKDGVKTTSWSTIARVALYLEHFKREHNFNVFEKRNRERRIDELSTFIKNNNHIGSDNQIIELIKDFYNGVSYGFQFEDLFISNSGNTKVLIMQKVELDETPKKCPACLESIVRGNSYPKILYKSFECQNPSCPSRSKIGRGKRYDLYGSKRQMMLERNSLNDHISDSIYSSFRRDIIEDSDVLVDSLISLYSWEGDKIELINFDKYQTKLSGRELYNENYTEFTKKDLLNQLDISKLFVEISKNLIFTNNYKITNQSSFDDSFEFLANSSDTIPFINKIAKISDIGGAVTSPPYYNAREYSQWKNLICYLIDMMINAASIKTVLKPDATYIYNIGDVVGQDNIYINSNMSKRRQMLGFYSIFIFETVGFKTVGNIIWDKGEVQSKRNSTPNHVSGYVKPVNSYEHCIIFSNNDNKQLLRTRVKRIETVKKINSKGENILGHTAPFPLDLPKLIIPFVSKSDYIIDPFLGSGTTMVSLIAEGYKTIGFEINEEYYNLANIRITKSKNNF